MAYLQIKKNFIHIILYISTSENQALISNLFVAPRKQNGNNILGSIC
jgi:hypothetical protein